MAECWSWWGQAMGRGSTCRTVLSSTLLAFVFGLPLAACGSADSTSGTANDHQFVVTANVAPVRDGEIVDVTQREVWLVDSRSGKADQLTDNDVEDIFAMLSPDRSQVAYFVENDDTGKWPLFEELWIMDVDGSDQHLLYEGPIYPSTPPEWSPDGRTIALSRLTDKPSEAPDTVFAPPTQISLIDIESGEARTFADGRKFLDLPDWSPDGTRIAFVSNEGEQSRIWIADADGSNAKRVDFDGNVFVTKWDFRGERVVFSGYEFESAKVGIWSVRRDGTDLTSLAENSEGFALSPDGEKITYVLFDSATTSGENSIPIEIWVANIDGTSPLRVASFSDEVRAILRDYPSAISLVWSPNSRTVLLSFQAREVGQQIRVVSQLLWLIDADGEGEITDLTELDLPFEFGFARSWAS